MNDNLLWQHFCSTWYIRGNLCDFICVWSVRIVWKVYLMINWAGTLIILEWIEWFVEVMSSWKVLEAREHIWTKEHSETNESQNNFISFIVSQTVAKIYTSSFTTFNIFYLCFFYYFPAVIPICGLPQLYIFLLAINSHIRHPTFNGSFSPMCQILICH